MTSARDPRTRTQRGYGHAWDQLVAQAKRTYPWTCWLCCYPIHPDARGRWGWSLDHLDPIAQYGTAIPTIDRVRPAHSSCNTRRSNQARAKTRRLNTTSRQW